MNSRDAPTIPVERLPFVITAADVARMLGVSRQDVEHSARIGRAAYCFLGKRTLYRRDVVEGLAERARQRGSAA